MKQYSTGAFLALLTTLGLFWAYSLDTGTPGEFFNTKPVTASYIYSPGLMTSPIAMGRYCPDFVAFTGERVTWKNGGHVIGSLHSTTVFRDVDLRKPGFTLNPITYIMQNIKADLLPLARRLMQDTTGLSAQDNPHSDLSIIDFGVRFCNANIGQKKDMKALTRTYTEHIKKYPDTAVVLYGDSRGAATTFNFIAQHKPAAVKAAVLEGIFDDVPHAVKHFLYTDKTEREEARLYGILRFVCKGYKKDGISPRAMAEVITDDVPLLFVISLKDGLVSPQCAISIYNRLRARGHQKVHLLVLKKSFHPGYMVHDPQDRDVYESTVHAFYKQYGLPHNAARARAGQRTFNATQPTTHDITRLYHLPTCDRCC